MKIELLTTEQYDNLMEIFKGYPNLSLQNEGYEYLDKSKFTDEEAEKFEEVENLLKKHISGFVSFSNFRLSKKDNKPQIRLQYNWDYDNGGYFTGVGYILIDELLNGFKEKEERKG